MLRSYRSYVLMTGASRACCSAQHTGASTVSLKFHSALTASDRVDVDAPRAVSRSALFVPHQSISVPYNETTQPLSALPRTGWYRKTPRLSSSGASPHRAGRMHI